MESVKHGNSETSIDENDHPSEKVNCDKIGTGRSYDCTFCKRGFTNAQALGGHMNIHRKDKAKVKQLTQSSVSKKSNENYMTSEYFAPPVSSSQQEHCYVALGLQMNYQTHFPASNPNFSHAYHQSDLADPMSQNLSLHEEALGSNLSLQIGPPYMEDRKSGKGERNANEVDLELRLGHDP